MQVPFANFPREGNLVSARFHRTSSHHRRVGLQTFSIPISAPRDPIDVFLQTQ